MSGATPEEIARYKNRAAHYFAAANALRALCPQADAQVMASLETIAAELFADAKRWANETRGGL